MKSTIYYSRIASPQNNPGRCIISQKTKYIIGIVGPCSAGKTTLISGLKDHEYHARHIAQEHSKVPDMWRRLVDPVALIYLDVSYTVSMKRRPIDMSPSEFEALNQRLRHAKQYADLYLDTNDLSPKEVLNLVLAFFRRSQLPPNLSGF